MYISDNIMYHRAGLFDANSSLCLITLGGKLAFSSWIDLFSPLLSLSDEYVKAIYAHIGLSVYADHDHRNFCVMPTIDFVKDQVAPENRGKVVHTAVNINLQCIRV